MAHRFVALLTCLLTAHLTFLGGDIACANHPADAPGMHHATAHHGQQALNVEHFASDDAPCRTPSVPMCCQALQSCTPAVALAEAGSVQRVSSARESAPANESAIPASEIIAPEPPPPRA